MADNTWRSLRLDCDGLKEIDEVARRIIEFAGDVKVWTFQGEMGAGKTTFIRSLCKHFGVTDNVSSPTFSLVNEYQNNRREVFYHFDFYRIKDETEARDIGTEDYFYSGDHCFIEWPSKVTNLIPDQYMEVKISVTDAERRSIQLTTYD
ncbi:tRNA (adenosine(37)-N6)-threonylcarbamoyltransferase complex ATPase subunit type 1 TsaE [Fulvivirga sp. M361]|uniref:tRNA (adenosine(37)-N6)-threonylcarbamoyltransferase complex ATPase subunit type 1 TsaE n=1 Tax=Fulvivirga sp. M361 TaxID=2594266 RepID=UPI00117BCA39|nr:tRNA (adenosine(37)-N6)-threonylcarbamoyltransferase complex ATPase subunit type 1 TsaE [Fulvivirga sp. M361]TRX54292.1 tRNA (adenosine(37)-N6)-threonylcarbamoyltransferase complex ATPase subunit type 1 TsaE [Fulvivirga sp. M361]